MSVTTINTGYQGLAKTLYVLGLLVTFGLGVCWLSGLGNVTVGEHCDLAKSDIVHQYVNEDGTVETEVWPAMYIIGGDDTPFEQGEETLIIFGALIFVWGTIFMVSNYYPNR